MGKPKGYAKKVIALQKKSKITDADVDVLENDLKKFEADSRAWGGCWVGEV
jgi:hypothetical protein